MSERNQVKSQVFSRVMAVVKLLTSVKCTITPCPRSNSLRKSTGYFRLSYRSSWNGQLFLLRVVNRKQSQRCRNFLNDFEKESTLSTGNKILTEETESFSFDAHKSILSSEQTSVSNEELNAVHYNEKPEKIFQVHSYQDHEELAASPAYPEALHALCVTYVASCFMERTWRFALPAVLALLCNNLLPVAVVSFVGQFVVFVGGPVLGAFMDSMPRVLSFTCLSVVQMISMLISAGMVIYALSVGVVATSTTLSFITQPWFICLVSAGAIERFTGLATGVAFERDWVVLLAGPDRSIALANANATLRRVDLICEIIGPFLFGVLLSNYNPVICVLIASAAIFGSIPVLVFLVQQISQLSKGVLDRPRLVDIQDQLYPSTCRALGLETVRHGWTQYLAQPILPASICYILLSFNTVLAPSGLMTSFLAQRGLNPSVIGFYRGMCAFMGFLATFLAASLIGKVGLLKAGALALTFQATLLVLAVLVYLTSRNGQQLSLLLFLVLVVLSRLGHWAYDMADAQIFQTAVPPSQANLVGTTEMSLASLAELIMLLVAIIANDVSYFGVLAALSMTAVAGAAWIYWHWLFNPTEDQRKLFPQDFRRACTRQLAGRPF